LPSSTARGLPSLPLVEMISAMSAKGQTLVDNGEALPSVASARGRSTGKNGRLAILQAYACRASSRLLPCMMTGAAPEGSVVASWATSASRSAN